MQPPPVHDVLHVPVVAQWNWHPPPGQSMLQFALSRQDSWQPPPEQVKLQVALPAHVIGQPPPLHVGSQFPEVTQVAQRPGTQAAEQFSVGQPVTVASIPPLVVASIPPIPASGRGPPKMHWPMPLHAAALMQSATVLA
jgi:hypothetical protein